MMPSSPAPSSGATAPAKLPPTEATGAQVAPVRPLAVRGRAHSGFVRESFDAYKRRAGLNHSTLERIRESPRHLQHYLAHGDKDTDAKRLGRALHILVLEPKSESECIAVWNKGDRRGNEWKEFEALNAGKDILKTAEYDKVRRMRDAVLSKSHIRNALANVTLEGTATWTDPETGILCKGRIDAASDTCLFDLKSISDFARHASHAFDLGYQRKAAWYLDGAALATKRAYLDFGVIFVETEAPHEARLFWYDPDAIKRGRDEYREDLWLYAHCMKNNVWPGYPDEPGVIDIPEYKLRRLT